MSTSSEFKSFARYGYSTTVFLNENENEKQKCPYCKSTTKRLHQPIKYVADYQVCGFCFDEVCRKIDASGFDRHGYSSNFDVQSINQ